MKYDLRKLLLMLSKQTIYVLIFFYLGQPFLFAEESYGQSIHDVHVSLTFDNSTIEEALHLIEGKTDFRFAYGEDVKTVAARLRSQYNDKTVATVLKDISSKTGIEFHQINKTISAKLNPKITSGRLKHISSVQREPEHSPQDTFTVTGTITNNAGELMPGVNVVEKGTANGTVTDVDGNYRITVSSEEAILTFSFIGYKTVDVPFAGQTTIDLAMEEDLTTLGAVEVYATGYQQIPPERATGSFAHVDQELIQRSTSTDIISRLESITPGLLFDKRDASETSGMDQRRLRIRGVSSIRSDNSPLIVVDNFPYEGDINSINPNDVESITVLRDAAAASIWGARAANGVIVITLKQGSKNQPLAVSVTSNVTMGERPDIRYSPQFIPSADYIRFETELFQRGYYNNYENSIYMPALSPVVELLIRERDNLISSEELNSTLAQLSHNDVRDEAERYFYRKSLLQQHAVSINGGSEKTQHYLSAGYDNNLSGNDGNELQRITLVSNNTFQPVKPLRVSLGINFSNQEQLSNGFRWGDIGTDLPYNRFADDQGNWLPVTNTLRSTYLDEMAAQGLLDWQYRPLQEKALRDISTGRTEYRLNGGLSYDFLQHFQASLKYQYQQLDSRYRNLQDKNSYEVRNQVNRFTQADGTQIFPHGDMLTQRLTEQAAHSARAQLNYQQQFGDDHSVTALAGMEARRVHSQGYGMQVYGYNDKVLTYEGRLNYATRYPLLPAGSFYLPQPSSYLTDLTDHYISYFSNSSYTFKERYTLSGSARYDASNLFGVKTNQKGVPLWSVGAGWEISDEAFYKLPFLTYLRLRTTYGYNGNINKSITAYPTASYSTDRYTNMPMLLLRSPGNPQLRWEKIRVINWGLDFEFINHRVSGTFEYFIKNGQDIIGEVPLEPTTGAVATNLYNNINYAETSTKGFDLQLSGLIIDQPFKWSANLLVSYTRNEILDFYNESVSNSNIRSGLSVNSSVLPQQGKSIDGLYSIPWWGLDPQTGDPLVESEGTLGTDYNNYTMNLTMDDLIYHGANVAPMFGAVRNNLSWKNLTLSVNISWKANYFLRKSGISYYSLLNNKMMHRDFSNRWMETGDELHTQVPSMPELININRDFAYTASEILVEKGDHIRLEDINLSYSMSKKDLSWLPMDKLQVFVYVRNLGILWQASDSGLDPDYPNASYLIPRSYSIGLNASF